MKPPLIVGNWKMNGGPSACVALARGIVSGLAANGSMHVAVAPPFIALGAVKQTIGTAPVALAAQNCHWEDCGAFTGEISPAMLAETGCDFVIIGHSERRHLFAETDTAIGKKISAVIRNGMAPILCVGETLQERENGRTDLVIVQQLDTALKGLTEDVLGTVEIAYEPVWAIGTGLAASVEQIRDVHTRIGEYLHRGFGEAVRQSVRILYGGSVKPDNAETIARIEAVGGLLVGGASLSSDSFLSIARAFSR